MCGRLRKKGMGESPMGNALNTKYELTPAPKKHMKNTPRFLENCRDAAFVFSSKAVLSEARSDKWIFSAGGWNSSYLLPEPVFLPKKSVCLSVVPGSSDTQASHYATIFWT